MFIPIYHYHFKNKILCEKIQVLVSSKKQFSITCLLVTLWATMRSSIHLSTTFVAETILAPEIRNELAAVGKHENTDYYVFLPWKEWSFLTPPAKPSKTWPGSRGFQLTFSMQLTNGIIRGWVHTSILEAVMQDWVGILTQWVSFKLCQYLLCNPLQPTQSNLLKDETQLPCNQVTIL